MATTKIRNTQAKDPDFAFQQELDTTRDNQTSTWSASTMNNKTLYDAIQATRDNGSGGFVASTMNNKTLYDAIVANGVYGQLFEKAEDWSETSTTGTTYVDKLNWTTASLTAGTYLILWSCTFRVTNSATDVYLQLNFAGTVTELAVVRPGASSRFPVAGQYLAYVTVGTAGTKTIKLQFKSSASGQAVYISNAVVTIRKVSTATS